LVEDGLKGVSVAIKKFDANRKTRFTTFAGLKIRSAMVRGIQNQGTIRVPVYLQESWAKVGKSIRLLETSSGKELSAQEIAKHSQVKVQRVQKVLDLKKRNIMSVDSLSSESDEEPHEVDVPGPERFQPERIAEDRERAHHFWVILQTMDEERRKVLELRFGLNGLVEHTFEEIGKILGKDRKAAWRIYEAALAEFQARISNSGDADFLE